MSKKTRGILFFIAVILFLAVSYVTVVYALGYQYDFIKHDFVRMGSFRVTTNTSADVYINEKLAGNTSFLNNSYAKGRLLPRTYTVRIEKKDYHVWTKNIPVVAGFFTDVPKILLLPMELTTEVISSSSIGFPMQDDTIRETKGRSLEFDQHKITVTWTDNTDFQPYHQTGDTEQIALLTQKIDDVQWYKDREHIIVSSSGLLSLMEIDNRGGVNSYPLATISGPFWYDKDENAIYAIENKEPVKIKL